MGVRIQKVSSRKDQLDVNAPSNEKSNPAPTWKPQPIDHAHNAPKQKMGKQKKNVEKWSSTQLTHSSAQTICTSYRTSTERSPAKRFSERNIGVCRSPLSRNPILPPADANVHTSPDMIATGSNMRVPGTEENTHTHTHTHKQMTSSCYEHGQTDSSADQPHVRKFMTQ